MAIPKNQPLVINQGADWSYTVVWRQADGSLTNLTGYSGRMSVRRRTEDVSTLIDLTTGNSRIALGGVSGYLTLLLSASETAALAPSDFDDPHVYDLEVVDGSNHVYKLLKGIFVNQREITRP